jgi:hypothetical protein
MPGTAYKGSPLAKARSDVGVAHRKRDPAAIEDARRNFATEKIADYIERVLAAAPPLRDDQRTRLGELLRPARQTPDRNAVVQSRIAELDGGGVDAA